MPEPTNQGGEGRPGTPGAEDDSTTLQIPASQVPEALANSPHPDQVKMYSVKINGVEEQWPIEKLVSEAQQAVAGRRRFEEAATIQKDAASAIALKEDLHAALTDQDADAFRRVGASFGINGTETEEMIQRMWGDNQDENVVEQYFDESNNNANRATRFQDNEPVDYSRLTPDLQRALRGVESSRIEKIVDNALDNDKTIAYNMETYTPEGRVAIRRYVNEKIRGRLDTFDGDFGDGTRILAEVLPEIREHLQALGTPGQQTRTGLGQAPGGGGVEVHPTSLPDHVPSTDEEFDQHVLETLNFHQSQAERGKQQ